MKTLKIQLRGVTPLLMNRYAGEKPSQKKAPRGQKTQAHIDEGYKRDWLERAYYDRGMLHLPPECIEGMLVQGAKSFRCGPSFKAGVYVQDDFVPLRLYKNQTDEPGTLAKGELESFYKPDYIDIRRVVLKGGGSAIDRCRPIFRNWGIEFTLTYDESRVEENQIQDALKVGAIGDFRPRFGRFRVVKCQPVEALAA